MEWGRVEWSGQWVEVTRRKSRSEWGTMGRGDGWCQTVTY